MLVLTRKPEQAIIIDGNIEVVVLEVKGDQVRLGIKAPREVSILRKEIFDQISMENQQAAMADVDMTEQITQMIKQAKPQE